MNDRQRRPGSALILLRLPIHSKRQVLHCGVQRLGGLASACFVRTVLFSVRLYTSPHSTDRDPSSSAMLGPHTYLKEQQGRRLPMI